MKNQLDFLKTTILGGVLVILPLAFVVMLLDELIALLSVLTEPLAQAIPVDSIGGVAMATIVSVLTILFLCFAVGLAIRTRIGSSMHAYVDQNVLSKIPGYAAFRSMSRQLAGAEAEESFIPAVITMAEDQYALGFIIEETDSGFCTVMIPSSPTPTSGLLRYVKQEHVRRINAPIAKVFEVITYWGAGTGKLVDDD